MEQAEYERLEAISHQGWNGQFAEVEAVLKSNLEGHPAYSQLYGEAAVLKVFMSEKKEDYEVAYARLDAAQRKVNTLYKQTRNIFKAFLKKLGADALLAPTREEVHLDTKKLKEISEESGENVEEVKAIVDDLEDDSTSSTPTPDLVPDEFQQSDLLKLTNGFWCKLMTAELLFWISVCKLRQQKYISGVFDFRKSWKTYEECEKIRQKIDQSQYKLPLFDYLAPGIDFGIGVFNFAMSSVPRHFQALVEGFGFKADRQLAVRSLTVCSQSKSTRACASGLCLSWIHAFFFYDFILAERLITTDLQRYPNSALLHWTAGYVFRKEGKVDEALTAFNNALSNSTEIPEFQLKIVYEIGYVQTLKLDWRAAIESFEKFLRETKTEFSKGYCAFQLALCYLNIDQSDKTMALMKKLQPWIRKGYAYDEFALRQAKKYVKSRFTAFEKTFHVIMILHEAWAFEEAISWLRKSRDLVQNDEDRACYSYILGSCLQNLNRFNDAKTAYSAVVKLEKKVKEETFTIPWSLVGLAEISLGEGDVETAEQHLKHAKSFSNYDFESVLAWRIRKNEDDCRVIRKKD